MFVSCMDKHTPRKLKRISKKRAPWITKGLLNKIHRRDLIKKKAISSNDHDMWEQFKCARNQANNAIKQAKKRYFSDNLKVSKGNPRKTWNLINELTSRNTSKSTNILEIQVDNRAISSPGDMAEAFNDHFTNIGQVLAQEVPAAEVNPEFYLSHTDKAFHLKTPSLDVVFNLLRNIDEKKATGLDMIPSKLLKMAASIVTPSLTAIFTKSIITGIYPTEWKMARVTPVFKNYEIILRKLSYFGADQATAKWFQSYLSNRTQRCNVNGNLSTASTVTCGVPQGTILGPLLFFMYINDLPNCLRVAAPRMFADDTSITLSAKTVADLKLAVTSELNNLTCWLRANKLSLNVAKTELMIIGTRQRLNTQCEEINISIDDRTIKRVDHIKSLGPTIDAQLSWSKHVDEISKKVSSAIGALKRVRPFIPTDVAVQIYNALILPHFNYCSPVWDGMSGCLSDKLQKLQNRAARVITQSPFDTSSNLLLAKLRWEKLSLRRKKAESFNYV